MIDRELAAYGAGLGERPQLVVLNKSDLAPRAGAVHGRGRADRGRPPRLVRDGSRDRRAEGAALRALPPGGARRRSRVAEELPAFLEYRPQPPERRRFRVLRTGQGFRVVGTAPEGEELEEALRDAGVKPGSEVEIGDEVMIWQ